MFVYNLVVRLYGFLIRISSLRNEKARQWVEGRRNWREKLSDKIAGIGNEKRIWVHCASYGEFEQGRPLMEAIRASHPKHKIILSFFSPSGYEAFKNWRGADAVCYLPLDTKNNARDFLTIVQPTTALFIKYEFWVNFLFQLNKNAVPSFLVSAVFKPHHPFFKWYGGLFRRSLQTFSKLFIQDETSGKLLKSIGINNFEVSGDTRFDRVLEIKRNFMPMAFFDELCAGRKVIVAGSTWPGDEEILIKALAGIANKDLLLIMAPHHVDEKSIASTIQRLGKSEFPFSLYSAQKVDRAAKVLVVDSIGLLSRLYYYANVTYVGGGFDSGIHNCLEPAVFNKPVIFHGGKDYQKYNEAVEMLQLGTARNIDDEMELQECLTNFLDNSALVNEVAEKQAAYFEKNAGTTQQVIDQIKW